MVSLEMFSGFKVEWVCPNFEPGVSSHGTASWYTRIPLQKRAPSHQITVYPLPYSPSKLSTPVRIAYHRIGTIPFDFQQRSNIEGQSAP